MGAAVVLGATSGCASTTVAPERGIQNVVIPVKDTTGEPAATATREAPPASGPAREYAFPAVTWAELSNGLKVATIQSSALPIVQIRVGVLAGKAAEGERQGLANLTGELLKDGGAGPMTSRELLTKIESLGSSLSITTGFDSTVLGLAVTKPHVGEAMDVLGALVAAPRFNAQEFTKLKRREVERTTDRARTSGAWAASMALYRSLYAVPSGDHPYRNVDATPSALQQLTVEDCRKFHKTWYVPKNVFVVVAGDITPEQSKAAVERAFGQFRGGEPPTLKFPEPTPPAGLALTVVDRPKSSQSNVYVGMLGPTRSSATWPAMAVANQVLGGGVAGRLFLDVREKQSLAYSTGSSLTELAHGPVPLIAHAGTQTAKTGLTVKALLDNLEQLGTSEAGAAEIDASKRYLSDVFAIKLETVGALASELLSLRTLGLPDDYDDGYRQALREVTAEAAAKAARAQIQPGKAVVVVAGDAEVIAPMLSRFGDVEVVDPTRDFAVVRTVAKDPNALLEVPRAEGR
jgi:predicted Zn-dependent peptidase